MQEYNHCSKDHKIIFLEDCMKKLTLALLVALILLSPVFAQGGEEKTTKVKSYTVNVASAFAPEGPIHDVIVNFKNQVESESNDRIKVVIHSSGSLGGEREIVEGLSAGTIEMGAQGIMDLTLYAPEYTVFEEPFVIRDLDHLNKFWNTIGVDLNNKASEKTNIITAGYMIRGARMITANTPIVSPEDFKGLKFRLPSLPVRIKVFEAMGAIPTVVDFPEVYMALKTGTVDAQENPPETIYSYKYYEAQKYLIRSSHVYSTARYQISQKWFENLSQEDQDLILKAWKDASAKVRSEVPDPDAVYIEKLKAAGMQVIEPNMEEFRTLAEPVMAEFDDSMWLPGLRQEIMAL